jgi:hypothetical protein
MDPPARRHDHRRRRRAPGYRRLLITSQARFRTRVPATAHNGR